MNIYKKGYLKRFETLGLRPLALGLFVFLVVFSFAGVHYVFADTPTTTQTLSGGIVGCDGVVKKCDFNAMVGLINTGIKYILIMTVPIAAIMFAWAGVLLVTKGESPQARERAKGFFINVVIGVVIALASFLIIKTILDALGVTSGWRIFTS